jgi:hypothetical protein
MTPWIAQISIDAAKDWINWLCRPASFFTLSCLLLAVFLLGHRLFTRPAIAVVVGTVLTLGYIAGAFDPDFLAIIARPDNIPITLTVFLVGFFTWLAFRRAAINDRRTAEGRPLLEAGAHDQVYTWPDLLYVELIGMMLCTAVLLIWAILFRAPLEQPADPTLAPNPAKAPWYFVGFQELLVYFDPWIAGVLLPTAIILGLAAIPYLDRNPRGNGYYTFRRRPFAITLFLFGWLILWLGPILIGAFLRGPGWNFFGPFETWNPQRSTVLANVDLRDIVWTNLLGWSLPERWWVREAPGILLLMAYFLVLPVVLKATVFRRLYAQMGLPRYAVMIVLFLGMSLVPIKMILRWTLNLHYIISINEYWFNI